VQPFLPADSAVEIDVLERYVHAEKGRADTLVELAAEATWLVAYSAPKSDDLVPKDGTKDDSLAVLTQLHESLKTLEGESWIQEVESGLNDQAEVKGKRTVFWPVRVALSGQQKSPDPITLMQVLGIEETEARIEAAIAALQ
jgi:glutamyl/glutaminyl-tRNA synthetase